MFSQQSFLHNSFFQNTYFFGEKFLPSSYFQRLGSFLGSYFFENLLFWWRNLFKIKIPTEALLLQSRYFCIASTFHNSTSSKQIPFQKKGETFGEKLIFQKKNIPYHLHFLEGYFFRAANFQET